MPRIKVTTFPGGRTNGINAAHILASLPGDFKRTTMPAAKKSPELNLLRLRPHDSKSHDAFPAACVSSAGRAGGSGLP
jgi:hypothetical protein